MPNKNMQFLLQFIFINCCNAESVMSLKDEQRYGLVPTQDDAEKV